MTDHEQGAVERYMANRRESHVDLGTVPCGICGERVRVGMNGMWSEYHDCKPVPLARLQQAERERDEARAALAVERQHRDGHLPSCAGIDREAGRCGCGYLDGTAYRDMTARMAQATALLRDVRHGPGWLFIDVNTRKCIDAALAEIGGGK